MSKYLFVPSEVLTFNKLDKLIVLPFGKMHRPKIPFRFKGKWFRRLNKKGNQCQVIEIIIDLNNKNMILCDYHDFRTLYSWTYKETLFHDDLIAVFSDFLTDWEKKSIISTFNLYEKSEDGGKRSS